MVFTTAGLLSLIFADSKEAAIAYLHRKFPNRIFIEDAEQVSMLGNKVFISKEHIQLCPEGTPFQESVWKALLEIPKGETRTYAQIADAIGSPKAVRAVGTAIGANPIAYLIPCHRVVRADGGLGGYRWGLAIKQKMLQTEGVNIKFTQQTCFCNTTTVS